MKKYFDKLLEDSDKAKTLRYPRHEYDRSQKSFIWLPAHTKSSVMQIKDIVQHASQSLKDYSWHYLQKLQWDEIELPGYLHSGEIPARKGKH